MRNFIELHNDSGRTWYVDPYRISAFTRTKSGAKTDVYIQGVDSAIFVTETPEQIIKMINEESW